MTAEYLCDIGDGILEGVEMVLLLTGQGNLDEDGRAAPDQLSV